MTDQEKAQAFLDEYKQLTQKHGLALQPAFKPEFQLIKLTESDSKAPETTQDDPKPAEAPNGPIT